MKQKLKFVIFILFFLALFIFVAKDVKLTLDTHDKVCELCDGGDLSKADKNAIKDWKALNKDRVFTCGFLGVFYIVVFGLIIKVGPAVPKKQRISHEEAAKLAKEIHEEYLKKGQFVEAKEEKEEYDSLDELDTPKLRFIEYQRQGVMLSWDPVDHAEGYTVYRKTPDMIDWEKTGANVYGATRYEDYKLSDDTTYTYTVRAFLRVDDRRITSGIDPLGKEIHIEKGNYPDIPKIFIKKNADGKDAISWDEIDGVRSYRIYKEVEPDKWEKIGKVLQEEEHIFYIDEMGDDKKEHYSVCAANYMYNHSVEGEINPEGIYI